MTAPVILSTIPTFVANGLSAATVNLPSGTVAGNLVLLIIKLGDTYHLDINYPTATGWSQFGLARTSGYADAKIVGLARIMQAGDTMGSAVLTRSGNQPHTLACVALRISGHHVSGAFGDLLAADAISCSADFGSPNGGVPDPPPLTATWTGSDTLWLAIGVSNGYGYNGYVFGTPSGYTTAESASDGTGTVLRVSQRSTTAPDYDENPDVFTGSEDGPGSIGATVAVRSVSTSYHYWQVQTNAPQDTAMRLVIFSNTGSNVTGVQQDSGGTVLTDEDGMLFLGSNETLLAAGTKRFAMFHNWNGVTGTTSIYGGPCIVTKGIDTP